MKRTLVALVVMLVLVVAQQPAPAQTPDYDMSAGYGYLPAGYGRLASAQMAAPASPAQGAAMPNATVPGPSPMPEYQGEPAGGEFFGSSGAGVGWQVIGEYLYLRPSNAEVTYAQVINPALGNDTIPTGRTGVSTPFYDPGFRVSAAGALGDCAAIGVSYTYFETTVNSRLENTENPTGDPTFQVNSLVFFPDPTITIATPGDFATARETLRFHLADVDYKAALVSGPRYCANMLIGARYASLSQYFDSTVNVTTGGSDLMYSNVRFDGGGLRFGLEGERQSPASGFLVYSKGTASFVAGTARADYSQFNTDVTNVVDAAWKSNRVVTMLDFEVGAGWASEDGTIRVTGGWMVSGWYNTVKVARLIRAVQESNPTLLDSPTENMLAFDGLVFRVEWRF